MEAELDQLKNVPGAADLHAKLSDAWKATATELDTLKADKRKLAAVEKDLAKYKADLDAAGKGADERVTALTKERDEAKAAADKIAADFHHHKLTAAIGDKLGITDATRRKRAIDAFTREYMPEGAGFNDKGELDGVEKALKTFREKEAFFFVESDSGFGGQRSGAGPAPGKPAEKKGEPKDKVNDWIAKLYPGDAKGAAK